MKLTTCYLCGSPAKIDGHDYGRRKIVRCSSECTYYEIDNTALSKLESADCPAKVREDVLKTVKEIAAQGREAEIVFGDTSLIAREKQG